MADLKEDFEKASKRVEKLSYRPDNDSLLKLYALFKQATSGDVGGSRPGILDIKGRKKYDAWTDQKGQSKEASMKAYIDLVAELSSRKE